MSMSRRKRGMERASRAPWRRLASTALVLGLAAGCRVPAPTLQQGLDYGFNSPQQTLASFRTAVQGNLLDEEFRCFSRAWKNRTNVKSINYYSEVRDELMSRVPQLRWALYRAEDPEVLAQWDRVALLQCRIPGPFWIRDRYLVFRMQREGYWKAWTESTPGKASEGNTVSDPVEAGVLEYEERYDVVRVNVDDFSYETEDTAFEAILAVQGGWHWKIEDFNVYDEPTNPEQFEEPVRLSIPSNSGLRR